MKSYSPEDAVVTINGKPLSGTGEQLSTPYSKYKQITSPEDIPENGIVYQWDCGFFYDWYLSGKGEDELENLFNTNLIYVKVGE